MKQFFKRTDGATAIEYGLILALIAIVIVTAITQLGTNVAQSYNNAANSFPAN